MAKKKKAAGGADVRSKFGDSVFVSGNNVVNRPKVVIPFSPAMDMMLGGGIQDGTVTIVTGKPKIGKTTSLLQFAANAQRPEYTIEGIPHRKVFYLDVESRLEERNLTGIPGLKLDEDHFEVITSTEKKRLWAEDFLEIGEGLLELYPGCVVIFDSFSQLCSEAHKENEWGKAFRDNVPNMISTFTKRCCSTVSIHRSLLLGVTHLTANPNAMGPMAPKTVEASGQKIQYALDTKIKATYRELYPDKEDPTGQVIHWYCETSALGPPHRRCKSLLRYGEGLDEAYEMFNLAVDAGIIQKSGAWFYFPQPDSEEKVNIQGMDSCVTFLKENPETLALVTKEFRELMNMTPC